MPVEILIVDITIQVCRMMLPLTVIVRIIVTASLLALAKARPTVSVHALPLADRT